jgi:Zn-dependent membrane protease YugP
LVNFLIFGGIGMLVSWQSKSKFNEYSQIGLANGLSGREVAEKCYKTMAFMMSEFYR